MSQPPRSPSPLTARLYDLEYPRSLGVYSTYQEVQSVVDTLADKQFPVQSTLIVGTDLKLMERVTGRKTWPGVILQGARSGLVMGLFMGLLLWLLNPESLMIVIPALVLGVIFFTISSVIGYAMTGGRRDFTSMTATIPMQYELLVEHKHAAQARQILADSGAAPAPLNQPAPGAAPSASPVPDRPHYGQPAQSAPTAPDGRRAERPSFGQPAGDPQGASAAPVAPEAQGRRSFGAPAATPPTTPAPSGEPSPERRPEERRPEERRPEDTQG